MIMATNTLVQRQLMVELHEMLKEIAQPLAEAFDSRIRAIDPMFEVDRARAGTESLLNALLESLPLTNNIGSLLPLASSVAQMHGGVQSAVSVHRHAAQALDWAMRDLLLDNYTPEARAAFAESTGFFIELLRRAGSVPSRTNSRPIQMIKR